MTSHHDTCAIVVTYNPDADILQRQLRALQQQCEVVLVDNGSSDPVSGHIRTSGSSAHLVELGGNRGIASAQNAGIDYVSRQLPHCRFVLLLDHDSIPGEDFVQRMRESYLELLQRNERPALLGPVLFEPRSNRCHGFHVLRGLRYRHVQPEDMEEDFLSCSGINSSGSFGELEVFGKVGPLRDDLFIDHVDTEWSLRALDQGYTLWGTRRAQLTHHMGDDVLALRLPGRTFFFPYRSPLRHRYLFRNSLRLLGTAYVPAGWKLNCAAKLLFTALLFGTLSRERLAQLRGMAAGLADGLAGRRGEITAARH